MVNFTCTLCEHKTFKNERGLNCHTMRIHFPKNVPSISAATNIRVFCMLCPCKSFKNKRGLIRHERVVHSSYNIPRAGVVTLPQEAIDEFKQTLVYMIQRQLSNNSSSAGSQCITIPCMESQFIGVFGKHITRHAFTRQTYECVFTGRNAYDTLCHILGDKNWRIRHYIKGQQTAVILVTPTSYESETRSLTEDQDNFDGQQQRQRKNTMKFEFSIR
ncbi:9326_t:CDS:1 [Scutellospora calospora]|uniref:9326_t:CDS:1 n=1 Tax=Scutellospora calospora TaxID=85575 RepID=A0ACA9KBL1_9GLOM|nr:9326_t:CDS:1 [Scutellospora calospora]